MYKNLGTSFPSENPLEIFLSLLKSSMNFQGFLRPENPEKRRDSKTFSGSPDFHVKKPTENLWGKTRKSWKSWRKSNDLQVTRLLPRLSRQVFPKCSRYPLSRFYLSFQATCLRFRQRNQMRKTLVDKQENM